MKVSIIVPVYNGERYIAKCIDSIIEQTYKNIEIIIINDGSTDNSEKIIEAYKKIDKRIILINQKNSGVSVARNQGISVATGDYISFVDSDDWLEKNFIERMVDIINKKNVDIVRCNYIKEFEHYSETAKLYDLSNKLITKDEIYKSTIFEHFLYNKKDIPNYVMLLLIKKDLLKNNIFFDSTLYMMEDVLFYQQLFNKCNSIYFLDECLYHYNSFGISATRDAAKVEKNIYGIMSSVKEIKKFFKLNKILFDDKLINSNQLNLIINYLQKVDLTVNALQLKKILSKLYKFDNFNIIIKNYKKSELNFYRNFIVFLMKIKSIKLLIFIMKLRRRK